MRDALRLLACAALAEAAGLRRLGTGTAAAGSGCAPARRASLIEASEPRIDVQFLLRTASTAEAVREGG